MSLTRCTYKIQYWLAFLTLAAIVVATSTAFANNEIIIYEGQLNSCVDNLTRNVQSNVCGLNSNATAYNEAISGAVKDFVAKCLRLQLQPSRALRIMVPRVSPMLELLQRHAAEYQAATGIRVVLNPVNLFQLGEEARQELLSNLTDFSDGWVIDPSTTGMIGALGGFQSLDQYVPEDPDLAWMDISRFFRQAAAMYDGKVIGIPLDGDLFLLYYRRDLFERYNLTVPGTWDDLTALATRMNDTDTDGDGKGDLYGICLDNGPPVCKASFLLLAMAAPYLQYEGTAQGVFFDPDTMAPLADNAAMVQAVRHYIDLWKLQPKSGMSCGGGNVAFRCGQCLMTIDWGEEFKANALLTTSKTETDTEAITTLSSPAATNGSDAFGIDSMSCDSPSPITNNNAMASNCSSSGSSSSCRTFWAVRGMRLGVARLPGALRVLNRSSGCLIPCDSHPDLCPYAKQQRLYDGRLANINFAPYSAFGGWLGTVSRLAPPPYQRHAYDFFASMAAPNNSWRDVLNPRTNIDPYRISQLLDDGDNGADFGRWLATGYDGAATRDYLSAIRDALRSENAVLDNRLQYVGIPYRLYYEYGIHNLTWNATPGVTVEAVLKTLQAQLTAGMPRAHDGGDGGLTELRSQYCKLIGCRITSGGGGKMSDGNSSGLDVKGGTNEASVQRRMSRGVLWTVVVVPVVAVALLVGALVVEKLRQRAARSRSLILSHTNPPGVGPATTLLVTDIESSTTLWEILPEDVMARAVEVHHQLLRASVTRCSGYESATEGDSFICAFHTASDAVQCAAQIQLTLLSAPWPPELLGRDALPAVEEVSLTPGSRSGEVLSMLSADNRGGGLSYRLSNPAHLTPLQLQLQQHHHSSRHQNSHLTSLKLPQKRCLRLGQWILGRAQPGAAAPIPPVTSVRSAVAGAAPGRLAAPPVAAAEGGDVRSPNAAATTVSPGIAVEFSSPLVRLVLRTEDDLHSAGMSNRDEVPRPHPPTSPLVDGTVEEGIALGGVDCTAGGGGSCSRCCDGDRAVVSAFGKTADAATRTTTSAAEGSRSAAAGCPLHGPAAAPALRLLVEGPRQKTTSSRLASPLQRSFSGVMALPAGDIEAPPLPPPAGMTSSVFGGVGNPRAITFTAATPEPASAGASGLLPISLPLASAFYETQTGEPHDTTRVRCLLDLLRLAWLRDAGAHYYTISTPRPAGHQLVLTANSSSSSGSPTPSANISACVSASLTIAAAVTADSDANAQSPDVRNPAATTPRYLLNSTQTVVLPPSSRPHPSQHQLLQQTSNGTSPSPSMFRALIVRRRREGTSFCGVGGGGDVTSSGGGNNSPVGAGRGGRATSGQHGSGLGGGGVTLYRGLRVRIGMASGLQDITDLSYVSVEARMHYSGPCMQVARAIVSAAAGGQVLLSDATFAAFRQESAAAALGSSRLAGGGGNSSVLVLHMGQHELLEGEGAALAPQQVYQAVPSTLVGRLALQPPLRVRTTFATGVLGAPVGSAAVAFTYTVGVESLMAWDSGVARQALALMEETFAREAMRASAAGAGVYIVEASGGLLLAAFTDPSLAVSCCLTAVAAMPGLPWPAALLGHALCEELMVAGLDEDGNPVEKVLFRGLRLKAGLDYGPVKAAINATTGRLSYRGRVMNRAARIANKATAGQVLCSQDLWHSVCNPSIPQLSERITAVSLGTTHLKGVPEPVELLVCRHAPPPARASSTTGPGGGGAEIRVHEVEMTDGLGI